MSFVSQLEALPIDRLLDRAMTASEDEVERILNGGTPGLREFASLLSTHGADRLEELARRSQAVTRQHFGKVIRLFAPLYLSNECINDCKYCGFSRNNPILRVTLSVEEVLAEARALAAQGFRNLLLVAGEHPKFVSVDYLANCVRAVKEEVPGVSLEVGPMETVDYEKMVAAGAEGLVVYQETYDRSLYAELHTAGPKRDFNWRLETPERAFTAGFRRLGIGALLGLADWRREAIVLAAHAAYLQRTCWRSQITLSLPRLRPCAGEFAPLRPMPDRELVQLVCSLRLFLPEAGIVLSTREPSNLRDGLIPLGVTLMSAGSHTEPGGYTGAGKEKIHYTQRGKIIDLTAGASEWALKESNATNATGQFEIADGRSPASMAATIRQLGYEPVWKDWDCVLGS